MAATLADNTTADINPRMDPGLIPNSTQRTRRELRVLPQHSPLIGMSDAT
jgi:hypothetical protein